MSRYIRLFAWESAHPSKIFLKFMSTNTTVLSDRCGRYRARISVTRHRSADCAMRGHLADGPMQRLRAKPGTACARAVHIMADEPFVEELTGLITRLAIGGLLHTSEAT